jgi:hypothetical protein
MASTVRKIRSKLREFALGLPETHEDLPWGERVVKVKKKVFVFLGRDMDTHFGFGVKLTSSHRSALGTPHTEPMGYGLGKSGWVSAKFEATANPSFELLQAWLLESYCAVAPKSLAARVLGSRASAPRRASPKKVAKTTGKPARKAAAKSAPSAKTAARRSSAAKRTPKR